MSEQAMDREEDMALLVAAANDERSYVRELELQLAADDGDSIDCCARNRHDLDLRNAKLRLGTIELEIFTAKIASSEPLLEEARRKLREETQSVKDAEQALEDARSRQAKALYALDSIGNPLTFLKSQRAKRAAALERL